MSLVDVLIPTYRRPTALAMALTALTGQTIRDFRVVIADQTEDGDPCGTAEVQAVVRILQVHGNAVDIHRKRTRRGMAEQRQFLLDQVSAPYCLFLDDDLILESFALQSMVQALEEEGCGFVGYPATGLSYIQDYRPHQEVIEFWQGAVQPEEVRPDSREWERYVVHNAANIYHIQERLQLKDGEQRKYKVAWIGGCVMYDAAKLRGAGGFSFWEQLPPHHCGEDVLAQLRVMAHYGGCGLLPIGAYHLELPTTLPDRTIDAPRILV